MSESSKTYKIRDVPIGGSSLGRAFLTVSGRMTYAVHPSLGRFPLASPPSSAVNSAALASRSRGCSQRKRAYIGVPGAPGRLKGPASKGLFRFWRRVRPRPRQQIEQESGAAKAARQEGTESENGPWGPFFVSATVKNRPGGALPARPAPVWAHQGTVRAPHSNRR
jgi:hypothetical protein